MSLDVAPGAFGAPLTEEDDRPAFQRLKCWTGTELARTDFPPLKWVVPGLIPAGLTLLVGAPKVGKSWAALDIALGTAAGDLVLGSLRVEGGHVLYLALEDGPRRVKERQALLSGARGASERLHVYCEWPRGTDAARAAWEWCAAHPDARLVIVDTLARVRPPRGAGNAYDEDTHALVPWQKIAEHFGIAVVIVHHDRKAESGDFVDAVSGTHGLAGVADTTLVLDRARMEDYGRLRLTGRDVQEQEVTLRRVGPAWMVHDGPAPDPDLGDCSAAILAWLQQQREPARAQQVADAVGEDVDKVRRYLVRLVDSGRASKTGRGLYRGTVLSVLSVSSDEGNTLPTGHSGQMRHTPQGDERPVDAA